MLHLHTELMTQKLGLIYEIVKMCMPSQTEKTLKVFMLGHSKIDDYNASVRNMISVTETLQSLT